MHICQILIMDEATASIDYETDELGEREYALPEVHEAALTLRQLL